MMKKLLLSLLFGILGVGVYGQTIKSLGYNTTNGQVVANTGTNVLTFTNRVYQSSTNTTNVPEFRLTTKSNNVASWFVYDGNQTNTSPQSPDWTVSWIGINHVPSPNGLDRARTNFSIGAHSLTLENMWVSPVVNSPVSETYFNTEDTNGLTTRTFFIMGSQTNSDIGGIEMKYPVTLTAKSNSIYWYGGNPQAAMTVFTDQEFLLRAENTTTNAGAAGRITFGTGTLGNTAFRSGTNFSEARHFAIGTTIYRLTATGIIFGSGNANANAAQPVHLAGNTRIDGSISFNATTNADITRTNLGLGWSALTNTNAAIALLGVNTNGQVIYNNTNTLKFTNTTMFDSAVTIGGVLTARTGDYENPNVGSSVDLATALYDNFHDEWALTTFDNQFSFNGAQRITNFRTAIGLGNGITTNRTFVSYDGTNYTTNSVTISNGIITGWTQ